jgi:hypothetical protein
MREVQITITLPEELVKRVHAASIAIESIRCADRSRTKKNA